MSHTFYLVFSRHVQMVFISNPILHLENGSVMPIHALWEDIKYARQTILTQHHQVLLQETPLELVAVMMNCGSQRVVAMDFTANHLYQMVVTISAVLRYLIKNVECQISTRLMHNKKSFSTPGGNNFGGL